MASLLCVLCEYLVLVAEVIQVQAALLEEPEAFCLFARLDDTSLDRLVATIKVR
jgi:hypothetical protein